MVNSNYWLAWFNYAIFYIGIPFLIILLIVKKLRSKNQEYLDRSLQNQREVINLLTEIRNLLKK